MQTAVEYLINAFQGAYGDKVINVVSVQVEQAKEMEAKQSSQTEISDCINCDETKPTHNICMDCVIKIGKQNQTEISDDVIIPKNATNVEVFAIKPDEDGKLFAYIGYKMPNGNFHFTIVPFTEPIKEISDEEITNLANEHILYNDQKRAWVIEGMKLYREQLKKK